MSEPTRSPLFRPACPYFKFNREERHLAAVLFHLLCINGNAARLVENLQPEWRTHPDEIGVYFEYSYLRDAWHAIERGRAEANTSKREILRTMLAAFGGRPELLAALDGSAGVREINHRFVRHPSQTDIQSPATWQLGTFGAEGSGFAPEDLLTLCKIKWAFRAKPDVVVQPSLGRAICLELKLESGEANYPATGAEIQLLRKRGLYGERSTGLPLPMRQTALQRLAMEHLFGPGNVEMVLVTPLATGALGPLPAGSEDPRRMSWRSLLDLLRIPEDLPAFVQAGVDLCRAAAGMAMTARNRSRPAPPGGEGHEAPPLAAIEEPGAVA